MITGEQTVGQTNPGYQNVLVPTRTAVMAGTGKNVVQLSRLSGCFGFPVICRPFDVEVAFVVDALVGVCTEVVS